MALPSIAAARVSSSSYPRNLLKSSAALPELDAYRYQLDAKEGGLFQNNISRTCFDLLQRSGSTTDLTIQTIRDQAGLEAILGSNNTNTAKSSLVFWHAAHSRQQLNVHRDVAYLLLTYWQIDAFFLHFLFLFGQRLDRKDSYFSSFRYRYTPLDKQSPDSRASYVSADICYNLQGVEPYQTAGTIPWSIRHTAIYHRIDFRTGTCTWLVVKGNDEMKKRIRNSLRTTSHISSLPRDSLCEIATVNEIVASWCLENWRWFLDSLDEAVDAISRSCLDQDIVGIPPLPRDEKEDVTKGSWMASIPLIQKAIKWWYKFGQSQAMASSSNAQPSSTLSTGCNSLMKPPPPEPIVPSFTFEQLQDTTDIEEKINSALLVLDGNLRVLKALRTHYGAMPTSGKVPVSFASPVQIENRLVNFLDKISEIENDMSMHRARCASLLNLVAERKELLVNILEYISMETSKDAAHHTEELTLKMNAMTSRTTQETVMMRVISLVTVIFLPGTFISTLMSTDIVRFPDRESSIHDRKVSQGALWLYLLLTLPMTAILVTWYLVHVCLRHRKKNESSFA